MLIAPAILALNGVALTVTSLMLLAGGFAYQVLRHWDIGSGSALQLRLERRTYLIATLVSWCLTANIVSLLVFVATAEQMANQFVGAMCATGVLNANPWGWPTLFLKMAVFFLSSTWLLLNYVDNRAPDYPLVRTKYGLLLAIVPLVALEATVQLTFFGRLEPNLITSCCGSLFTAEGEGVAATVSALDPVASLVGMYASGLVMLALGAYYRRRHRGVIAFTSAGVLAFLTALAAIVSCVALYVYEHPHHHCPFCILKGGHGYIGYWLYVPLFAATALVLGVGLFTRWARVPSLTRVIAQEGRRFTGYALALFGVFYGVATYAVLGSRLSMVGVWW